MAINPFIPLHAFVCTISGALEFLQVVILKCLEYEFVYMLRTDYQPGWVYNHWTTSKPAGWFYNYLARYNLLLSELPILI